MSRWALDPCFWCPVVPGVESDDPPSRLGFNSQWALPMSYCFCMFCSSSLGILKKATQDVLRGRVGSRCPPLSCLQACSFVISTDYCTLPLPGHGLEFLHVPMTMCTCFPSFVV